MRVKQQNKIRKSTKYFLTCFAVILILISSVNLMQNLSKENIKTRTKEIYNYTNKFNYDYKVNLLKNKYIDQNSETNKSLVYVTGLIDTTDLTLNYDYISDKKSNLKYTYSAEGNLKATYTKNGEEQKILDEKETIIEETSKQINDSKFNITEKLNIDLKEKNNMLEEFKQKMGMSIDANYVITLKVNISTNIEDKQVSSNYQSAIQFDLAEKTTKITGENNKEDKEYISKEYNVNSTKNVFAIVLDIIFIGIAIIILKYVNKFRVANRVRNEYRQELNRILKICQDKIVQVNSKPTDKAENIVHVKDFGEIVKVSEELFKPILYYFDNEKQEAWFSVMTGTVVYRFIFKK